MNQQLSPWLTADEVRDLTGRRQRAAQLRQLRSLKMMDLVQYRTDGTFVVKRTFAPAPQGAYHLNLGALRSVPQKA